MQFRLIHVFLLTTLVAFPLALWYQRQRHEETFARVVAPLRQQLARAKSVLRENQLDWQLEDLKADHARIVIDDIYGDRPARTSNADLIAKKVRIRTVGPATVFLVSEDGKTRNRVLSAQAAAGEATRSSITVLAQRRSQSRTEYVSLDVSLEPSTHGFVGGYSWHSSVESKPLDELFEFRLKSGDFPRGQPVDFFKRHENGKARLWQLLVQ